MLWVFLGVIGLAAVTFGIGASPGENRHMAGVGALMIIAALLGWWQFGV